MITKLYSYCANNTDPRCLASTGLKPNHTVRKRTLLLRVTWIPTAAPLPLSFPWLLLFSRLVCSPNLLSQHCSLPLPYSVPYVTEEKKEWGLKTHSFSAFPSEVPLPGKSNPNVTLSKRPSPPHSGSHSASSLVYNLVSFLYRTSHKCGALKTVSVW